VKHFGAFFELLLVVILPSLVVVGLCFVEVVDFRLWFIGCRHTLLEEGSPVEVTHPYMLFQLRGTIQSKPVARLSLQKLNRKCKGLLC
jgi:hypothetical protein